ncbi:hypothetical protein M2480_000962 [Parabacteroides sp. PFB2-12]|uniref:BACON domain-containing protein n=1 Tax=unclassified Parabacteroides TaxID=2649774 RepID=UPI002475A26C|nr:MULTISPECIES: BACON domain-containing protein [unclassified Parabacteroides]MDH6341581.1 hypothetical protein [Parabacteroides sp. PM6-13]MDH6389996.1 hypothetical protein [Parabacteroides sp. PFB2-12]
MKKRLPYKTTIGRKASFAFTALWLLFLSGCEDLTAPINPIEEEPIITVTTGEASDILKNSASVKINVSPIASIKKAGVVWGTDNTLKTNTEDISTTDITSQEVSLTLLNLTDNTDYYYRAYATDFSNKNTYGEVKSFKTGSHQFTVSTTNIEAGYSANDYSFTIHSDITWAITSNQSWCKVQPASGSGNAEIKIQLEENLLENERTAILTISPNKNVASQTITVKQATKGSATFSDETIAASTFERGSGTEDDPFLIVNASQLKKLVDDLNKMNNEEYTNKHLKLMTDIHVTADEWIPINFSNGTFDGNGYTIRGLLFTSKDSVFGFFGRIKNSATVKNLHIAAEVKNEYYGSGYFTCGTGAVVGITSNSIIENCTFSKIITAMGNMDGDCNLGGIVGMASNTKIQNCKMTGTVKGGVSYSTFHTGGIIGLGSGTISGCTVSGFISAGETTGYGQAPSGFLYGQNLYTGGIAGRFGDFITECAFSGTITGGVGTGAPFTGGIAGSTEEGTIITNCAVSSPSTINGGIVVPIPLNTQPTVCYTGGIIGLNFAGSIHNCTNSSIVNEGEADMRRTGGIAGSNSGEIYFCNRNTGIVNGLAANSENIIGYGNEITSCPHNHPQR